MWDKCRQCKQKYHGVVACALGWACWKTYVGRPETDLPRRLAMTLLGNGLGAVDREDERLGILRAELAMEERIGDEERVLNVQGNLALCLCRLGYFQETVALRRGVYADMVALHGPESLKAIISANNLGQSLALCRQLDEAREVWRDIIPVAIRTLGPEHLDTLNVRSAYAMCAVANEEINGDSSRADLVEAAAIVEDVCCKARRTLGPSHPKTQHFQQALTQATQALKENMLRESLAELDGDVTECAARARRVGLELPTAAAAPPPRRDVAADLAASLDRLAATGPPPEPEASDDHVEN